MSRTLLTSAAILILNANPTSSQASEQVTHQEENPKTIEKSVEEMGQPITDNQNTDLNYPPVTSANDLNLTQILKKINKGNHEISPDLSLSHSSYSGTFISSRLAYRYFVKDRLSFGGIAGASYSKYYKSISLGPSVRWYFYESGRWATSLTQSLIVQNSFNSLSRDIDWRLTSSTELGVHYFVTPEVSLSLSLGSDYIINGPSVPFDNLKSRIGINFNF